MKKKIFIYLRKKKRSEESTKSPVNFSDAKFVDSEATSYMPGCKSLLSEVTDTSSGQEVLVTNNLKLRLVVRLRRILNLNQMRLKNLLLRKIYSCNISEFAICQLSATQGMLCRVWHEWLQND